jgi:hypothetical protein
VIGAFEYGALIPGDAPVAVAAEFRGGGMRYSARSRSPLFAMAAGQAWEARALEPSAAPRRAVWRAGNLKGMRA